MGSRVREDLRKSVLVSTGWLFADLLLALAMLFLAVNTVSQPESLKVMAKPSPTAVPPQRLEQNYHTFIITIDRNKLLGNDSGEKSAIVNQVQGQKFLRGRSAGLIIVYGGAPTINDMGTALNIARVVYATLLNFGKRNATFAKVSAYNPLYLLGADLSKVQIDVFLFAK